jgi:serine/threonine protein kinase
MAPEFLRSGIITLRTDIYSLGVIIIEILTGSKECPNVNKVVIIYIPIYQDNGYIF